jgi:predicted aldo/keto reductase-like oxidoreductase
MVGAAVKASGLRERLVLCTKAFLPNERRGEAGNAIRDFFLSSAEESLRRLQTDHVEVFYSHNVSTAEYLNHPGVLEALAKLKKAGKARFIGFSTHANTVAMLKEAARTGVYDVILTTFNYANAGDRETADALAACRGKGIGLVAMKTQCMQAWYKMNLPEGMQKYYEGNILHSALLKWVLKQEAFSAAVPGFTTFPQMEEDAAAGRDPAITPEEKRFLEDRGVKLALQGVCRQCGGCVPTCPKGADVPTLMRAHMYAASYRNFVHARATLREAAPGRGVEACASCGTCTAACVRRVGVGHAVDELRQMFG